MEDLSPETEEKDETKLTPKPIKKKGQSHHPALMNLAASPTKDGSNSAIA